MKTLVERTEEKLGPVDILVNCAGLMYYTHMTSLHVDEWDRQIDVNCKVCETTIFLCRDYSVVARYCACFDSLAMKIRKGCLVRDLLFWGFFVREMHFLCVFFMRI